MKTFKIWPAANFLLKSFCFMAKSRKIHSRTMHYLELRVKGIYFFEDAGEIQRIVFPLTNDRPKLRFISLFTISFVLSTTIFMWISNASNVPTNCLLSFNSIKISLPFDSFNKSNGLSMPLTIIAILDGSF